MNKQKFDIIFLKTSDYLYLSFFPAQLLSLLHLFFLNLLKALKIQKLQTIPICGELKNWSGAKEPKCSFSEVLNKSIMPILAVIRKMLIEERG